jgi:hypothetical protein
MKRGFFSPPALACFFVAAVLGALTLGSFMRETDEGWLLDGGMSIANSHAEIARAEFNFDKQFVSYYLVGELFKLLPHPFSGDELLLAANVFGLIFFWGAMFFLLARSNKQLSPAVALPVILTPAFLCYSPFYASAFTSAASLILLAIFLERKKWNWPLHLFSFALAFLAVGARADAMFLLPLLAVLHSPQKTFAGILKSPNTWLLAAGGLAAFFLGRALYLTDAIDYVAMSFKLKPFLAFVIFGLGGTTCVLFAAMFATANTVVGGTKKLWSATLLATLLLPTVYYTFQLLSPRHCTACAIATLIFISARRGQAILRIFLRPKILRRTSKIIFLTAGIVPVFLGLNLTDLHHPKITFTRPTLLPTSAGAAPCGAYLAFAQNLRGDGGWLDHNQAVWTAAQSVNFATNAAGHVPYLSTPLASYFVFSIRLQGKIPERHSLGENPPPPWFYAESRSLMRFEYVFPLLREKMAEVFSTLQFTNVAAPENAHGLAIWRVDARAANGADKFSAGLWGLNSAFGADEFRLAKIASLEKIPEEWAGKKLVVACAEKISVQGTTFAVRTNSSQPFGEWQIFESAALRGGEAIHISGGMAENVFIGISAYPSWMSFGKN